MLDNLVIHSNQFFFPKKTQKELKIDRKEIEKMIGMYFRMGIVKMSGNRVYWEKDTRYDPVASVMTRDRFLHLLRSINFVDNLGDDNDDNDKLWKVRPWFTSFRENCLKVVQDEHNCIDEMMVPFKGKFSGLKQYIRGTPNPWGLKIWARTTLGGMLCNFDVYQGRRVNQPKSALGVGADVVLKLCETLTTGCNYKVYADNFFYINSTVTRASTERYTVRRHCAYQLSEMM